MPEIVKNIPDAPKQVRKKKYPWDEWFALLSKGVIVMLRPAADFQAKAHNFVGYFRREAKARGVPCEVVLRNGRVYVQPLDPKHAPAGLEKKARK